MLTTAAITQGGVPSAPDVAFEQLIKCKIQIEPKTQPGRPDWISADTHALLDKRARLQKHGASQWRKKQVGRHIKSSMRRDWRSWAEEAGKEMEQLLEANKVSRAFTVWWYRKSTG